MLPGASAVIDGTTSPTYRKWRKPARQECPISPMERRALEMIATCGWAGT